MAAARNTDRIEALRQHVLAIEQGATAESRHVLPFGIAAIDRRLPGGGLALRAIHEVEGGGADLAHAAAAAIFVAGITARLAGPVLWCMRWRDLFAPSLAAAGLHPDRVIFLEAEDDAGILSGVEEGLRHSGLAAVVGELTRLPMAASRRLQLAAEASGVTALLLRRWRREGAPMPVEPTATRTRWRVSALPAAALPAVGVGRARWRLELLRARGAEPFEWIVEACDAQGRVAVPADLADRSAASAGRRSAAA